MVAAFSFFNPKVIPDADLEEFKGYSDTSIDALIMQYETTKAAEIVNGDKSPQKHTHAE